MKKAMSVACIILCIFFIAGCSVVDKIQTPDEDLVMVKMFNAFENQDYDVINDNLVEAIIPDDPDAYELTTEYVEGTVIDYEKIGYYYNVSVTNDEESVTKSLTYNVNTDYDSYVVSMILLQTSQTDWKVYGFNIIRASELKGNGAIIDFNNFDLRQLLLLLFSVGCIGLVVYAIVVCAKSPIRKKALWIVLILLLHSGISLVNTASNFSFKLLFININISYLQKFVNGDTVLQVLIPLGAILFLCLKKRLIDSARRWNEKQEAQEVLPQEPEQTQKDIDVE